MAQLMFYYMDMEVMEIRFLSDFQILDLAYLTEILFGVMLLLEVDANVVKFGMKKEK